MKQVFGEESANVRDDDRDRIDDWVLLTAHLSAAVQYPFYYDVIPFFYYSRENERYVELMLEPTARAYRLQCLEV